MFLKGIRPFLWIAAVGFAVYAATLSFGIVHLDDSRYILDNYPFNRDFQNILTAFKQNINYPSGSSAYYRPLQAITHIIDAQFGGTNPFFYHVTNIILHVTASLALFLFLLKMGLKKDLALFLALIFTAHPSLVGAVAWIPGRIDSLLAIFVLLSFIFFVQYRQTKKTGYLAGHVACFALALFTKESAVVLPPILIIYLFVMRERVFSRFTAPFFIGWLTVLTFWYFLSESVVGNVRSIAIPEIAKSIAANGEAVLLYLGKMLLPFNLAALPTLKDSTIIYGIITIFAVTAGLYWPKNKRRRFVLFGVTWFFLFLLPSFYTDDPSSLPIFMEHRAYLPLIGFLLILAEIDVIKNLNFGARMPRIAGAALVVLFAALAVNHSLHFKNRGSFWTHAVNTSPNLPKAHHGLGTVYLVSGEPTLAETEYKKALALNPDEWFVHGNLGLLYMQNGDLNAAEEEYKKELDINPTNTNTLLNLGILYYSRMGRFEEAKEAWGQALAINAYVADAHEYLAIYYYEREQDTKKTIYHINEALKRGGKVQQELLEIYDMINSWKP